MPNDQLALWQCEQPLFAFSHALPSLCLKPKQVHLIYPAVNLCLIAFQALTLGVLFDPLLRLLPGVLHCLLQPSAVILAAANAFAAFMLSQITLGIAAPYNALAVAYFNEYHCMPLLILHLWQRLPQATAVHSALHSYSLPAQRA